MLHDMYLHACVWVGVCMRASARARACGRVRVRVRACVRACVCDGYDDLLPHT